jgi:hypothetical protein
LKTLTRALLAAATLGAISSTAAASNVGETCGTSDWEQVRARHSLSDGAEPSICLTAERIVAANVDGKWLVACDRAYSCDIYVKHQGSSLRVYVGRPQSSKWDLIVQGSASGSRLRVEGSNQADLILIRSNRDAPYLAGGPGDDVLFAGVSSLDHAATTKGQNGDDVLLSGAWDAKLKGGSGRDVLVTRNEYNSLHGGGGADLILGLGNFGTLRGGTGDDTLIGHSIDNLLEGQAGHDLLHSWSSGEPSTGGAGDDWVKVNGYGVVAPGASGTDTCSSKATADCEVLMSSAESNQVTSLANHAAALGHHIGDSISEFDNASYFNINSYGYPRPSPCAGATA